MDCFRTRYHWLPTFVDYEKRQCELYGKSVVIKGEDGGWTWACWCHDGGSEETWERALWSLEAHMFEGDHSRAAENEVRDLAHQA